MESIPWVRCASGNVLCEPSHAVKHLSTAFTANNDNNKSVSIQFILTLLTNVRSLWTVKFINFDFMILFKIVVNFKMPIIWFIQGWLSCLCFSQVFQDSFRTLSSSCKSPIVSMRLTETLGHSLLFGCFVFFCWEISKHSLSCTLLQGSPTPCRGCVSEIFCIS